MGREVGADRVELYTEPFARAFEQATGRESSARLRRAPARALGLGVNAGHDLDLENLVLFQTTPTPGRSLDRPRPRQPGACSSAWHRASATISRCWQ